MTRSKDPKKMAESSIQDLISRYGLSPHPEGGHFRETFRSPETVHSNQTGQARPAATHIYFLLAQGEISRFHKVVHDEIWHHYQGAPVTLFLFDGATISQKTIGPGQADHALVVPGNVWQAAQSEGAYSFTGCTVAPGFDFQDFSLLSATCDALKHFKAAAPGFLHLV